ncbi:MAG: NAD-dependent deacylase [Gammaproteobacteria bacterium]|nr:MAG: NAD-dependent deacylase [Gammaproteobacteria bacterium]
MKKLVVLSGAGISAESGIKTFRDAGGLWEGHDVTAVASPQGWAENPRLVLDFYNQRRRQLLEVSPNAAHVAVADLQNFYEVTVVTQNVDDLHERAGAKRVLHLHGELKRVRSEQNPDLSYSWEKDLHWGDIADDGAQLRPDIVWFGEEVPLMPSAVDYVSEADVVLIIGTSLQVYPAAGLIHYAAGDVPIYYIDPKAHPSKVPSKVICLADTAVGAMQILYPQLVEQA